MDKMKHAYVSKPYQRTSKAKKYRVFMERITDGKGRIQCYEYLNTSGEMGFRVTFIEKNNKMVEVRTGKFSKKMAEYFSDYPDLQEKIAQKKLKYKHLTKIIEEYNTWYSNKKT